MGQVPALPGSVNRQSLLNTAALAIVTAAAFDLSQIASLGAMLYLSMNITIHWGIIRHHKDEVDAKIWMPAVAIGLDRLDLAPFVVMKFGTDPHTLGITVAGPIVAAQWWAVRHRSTASA